MSEMCTGITLIGPGESSSTVLKAATSPAVTKNTAILRGDFRANKPMRFKYTSCVMMRVDAFYLYASTIKKHLKHCSSCMIAASESSSKQFPLMAAGAGNLTASTASEHSGSIQNLEIERPRGMQLLVQQLFSLCKLGQASSTWLVTSTLQPESVARKVALYLPSRQVKMHNECQAGGQACALCHAQSCIC